MVEDNRWVKEKGTSEVNGPDSPRLCGDGLIPVLTRGHLTLLVWPNAKGAGQPGEHRSVGSRGRAVSKRTYGDGSARHRKRADVETPNIKREFILTQSTDDTLQDLVRVFSRATGANLTNSHFLRVVLKALAHAMPELEREASELGSLKRPSNARGNQAAREGYEEALAVAVASALQASPRFEPGKPRKTKSR